MKTYLYEKMQLITKQLIQNDKLDWKSQIKSIVYLQTSINVFSSRTVRNIMNLWSNDSSNLTSCRCSNPHIHNNQQVILVSLSQSHRWCLDLRLLPHSPSCSPQSRSTEPENTGNIQHWSFIPAGQKQNFPQMRRKDGSSQLWLCRPC